MSREINCIKRGEKIVYDNYSISVYVFGLFFFMYLFFFLCAVSDSWPLSSSLSSDWLLLVLLEELLEEPLEESLATPVSSFTSIVSAKFANSGSLSLSTFNHFRDNFGLPRTCLWWIYIIQGVYSNFAKEFWNFPDFLRISKNSRWTLK